MHPYAALMRRYCIDYTTVHDASVCDDIMRDDYTVTVSGRTLQMPEYRAAVQGAFGIHLGHRGSGVGLGDGDRRGVSWGNAGGWKDGTAATFPDWMEIAFSGMRWYGLDPQKVVVLTEVVNPNLKRVDEVGLATLAPGVIDTDMQVQLRGAEAEMFPDRARFERLKAETPEFEAVTAFQAGGARVSVRRQGVDTTPRPLRSEYVTGNYFSVMGLAPIIGRSFGASDDGTAAAPVMMLTHAYWLKRFGGDSSIVGRKLILNGIVWSAKLDVPPDGVQTTLPDLSTFEPAAVRLHAIDRLEVTRGGKFPEHFAIARIIGAHHAVGRSRKHDSWNRTCRRGL